MSQTVSNIPTFYLSRPDNAITNMMHAYGYASSTDVADADVVVFPGGYDISPLLYGEYLMKGTSCRLQDDLVDLACLRKTRKGQAKVGICRGAQFLNVMVGNGTLWQDVSDHAITGGHDIYELDKNGNAVLNSKILATSTHHQMMRPSSHGTVLWSANLAKTKYSSKDTYHANTMERHFIYDDPEVVYYQAEHTLCFQPHPEYTDKKYAPLRDMFFEHIDMYLLPSDKYQARTAFAKTLPK